MKACWCNIIVFALSSCSWSKTGLFLKEEKKEDLLEVLNVDKMLVRKFKEKPMIKEVSGEGDSKKITKKKINSSLNISSGKEKVKMPDYPQDYPDEYRGYNQKYAYLWRQALFGVLHGEEMEVEIKYFNVVVGKIIIKTMPNKFIGDNEAYHIRGEFHSAPSYRYIYEVRDTIETFLDIKTFLPLKYSLIQKESGKKVNDLQIFDHGNHKTYFWYRKEKKGKVNEDYKIIHIPAYFQDYLGVFQFIRNLPLTIGQVFEIPLVNRARIQFLKIEVLKKEKIEFDRKKHESIKMKGIVMSKKRDKKKTTFFVWLANDKTKRILRFNIQTKLGMIYARLVRYQPERKRSGG